jgi:hypothetical protein
MKSLSFEDWLKHELILVGLAENNIEANLKLGFKEDEIKDHFIAIKACNTPSKKHPIQSGD